METIPDYVPGTYSFPLYRYYDEFSDYPLSNSLGFLTVMVIAYLAFVLKIGPDLMKNRPAYSLKNTILVYNAIQVILSALFVYLTLKPMLIAGLFPKTSVQNEDPKLREMMFYSIYMYFLGKITELLDTIFFVLRKKHNQVSFLHVYHHSSVIIGTWLMVFYSVNPSTVYAAFMNSFVHVVMYFYYFMAALGPQYQKYLTWKKYITSFQLIQFVTIFLHQTMAVFITKGEHTLVGILYVCYSAMLFYILFSSFYNQSYKKPKSVSAKNENGALKPEESAKEQ